MTATVLTGIASALLSILFEYVPGLRSWYGALKDNLQRLIMLGLLVVVAGVIFGWNCSGWFSGKIPAVSCDQVGVQELVWLLVIAVASNQATHRILPKSNNV
jgi:hypothetical protein